VRAYLSEEALERGRRCHCQTQQGPPWKHTRRACPFRGALEVPLRLPTNVKTTTEGEGHPTRDSWSAPGLTLFTVRQQTPQAAVFYGTQLKAAAIGVPPHAALASLLLRNGPPRRRPRTSWLFGRPRCTMCGTACDAKCTARTLPMTCITARATCPSFSAKRRSGRLSVRRLRRHGLT